MKNLFTNSAQKVQISIIMLMGLLGLQNVGLAQTACPDPIITDGSAAITAVQEFCSTLCDTLTLDVDENTTSFSSSVVWSGPAGFTESFGAFETDRSVEIPMDATSRAGEYIVEVTYTDGFGNTCVGRDTIEVEVLPVVEMVCPTDAVVVTPDLAPSANCATVLPANLELTSITAVNCTDAAWDYAVVLCLSDGTQSTIATGNATALTSITTGATATAVPFGNHSLKINITDPSGTPICAEIVQQCIIDLDVLESINNLACNDLVNVTMTDDCEAIITPAMVLEGDYCFDAFIIDMELTTDPSVTYSDTTMLTIDQTGLYNVTVTGQSGLSCWGQIYAEDKSIPEISCDTVQVYCTELDNLQPGSTIKGWDREIKTNPTNTITFDLTDISGSITNVVLNFEAQVANVSDLALTLESPEGTVIDLLDLGDATALAELCTNSNINVCLSDDGILPHSMFGSPVHCLWTENAFIGSFRPLDAFSTIYGENAVDAGSANPHRWTLTVTTASSAVTVIEADLQVTTNEGSLLTSADVIENSGCDATPEFAWDDVETGVHCAHDLWSEITRTWTVVNGSSGQSATCEQIIQVKRYTAEDIIWPKNQDNIDTPALTCDEAMGAGTPLLPCGKELTDCGNFQLSGPTELDFPICGSTYKRIYSWTVLDWCVGEIVERDQVVKVEDNSPLSASCAPDNLSPADAQFFADKGINITGLNPYMTTTKPGSCAGDWDFVPPLELDNACDDAITYTLSYLLADPNDPTSPDPLADYVSDNVQYDANGYPTGITDLPGGQFSWIRIEMEDECGNKGECFSEVYVKDDTSPNPVCVEFTVVALGDDGCGYLPAQSVDNLSWDNCGIKGFKVRRSTDNTAWGNFDYDNALQMCCVDCNDGPILVHLLVTDNDGNTNTCEAEVRLQDNIPIQRVSDLPQNVLFDCTESPVSLSALIQASLAGFEYTDNCGWDNNSNTVKLSSDTDANAELVVGQCGSGSYTAKYEVYDKCGNPVPGSPFSQTFSFDQGWLQSPGAFNIPDSAWPANYETNSCASANGLRPTDADFEGIRNGANRNACTDLAITFDDLVFHNVDNACLKILREWTVVDWCLANSTSIAAATRKYTQEIKVFNLDAPVISMDPITVDTNRDDCQEVVDSLVATITDACTDMFSNQVVTAEYVIDFADGTSDSGSGEVNNGREFSLGSATFPVGTSTISIWAEDHCGNRSPQPYTTTVTVRDIKAPTPYCRGEVVTVTMSTNNGEAEIWAEDDYDLGGTDNCDDDLDIYFVYNNVESDFLTFDCNDIPNGVSNTISLEVHYRDDSGNSDFCIVRLTLQDNESDICPNTGSTPAIVGNVHTEEIEMVEDVMVTISGPATEFNNQMMTLSDGDYAFNNLSAGDYSITGEKEDHPLNGVSTLDIVIIQKHILGIETFASPYKVIAADANDDSSVTALDLIEIRKLILGITEEFPNGQKAWRFPEAAQLFANPAVPFPYNEQIDLYNVSGQVNGQDFMAVKIGDVNGNATVNSFQNDDNIEKRNAEALTLEIENLTITKGAETVIPVYAQNMNDIIGFQTTLNFDAAALEFAGVQSELLEFNESNLGLSNVANGALAISWNSTVGITVDSDEPLFNLVFTAKDNGKLNKKVYANSALTSAEAYTSDLSIIDVDLNVRGIEGSEFVLYQNVPNPFSNNTEIVFSLPGSSDVTFSVFDVNGREVLRQNNTYNAGTHSITLNKEDLNATSVMYYTIESAFGTGSKKMIQIR